VQVNLPEVIADEVMLWGYKKVKDKDLYTPPEDYIHGREEEPHVTVLYGIHSQLPTEVTKLISNGLSFDIKLKNISIFTNNAMFDVVKVEAISPSLNYFNSLLRNNVGNTQYFNNYQPHVTVAYIKKGKCSDLCGGVDFKDVKWNVNTVIFSSKNGEKTPIRLKP
jgi:2'-5' RNA ligase